METDPTFINPSIPGEVIGNLLQKLRAYYVLPGTAEKLCESLQNHLENGDYAYIDEGELLALTLTYIPGKRFSGLPVYILTSSVTFSGGEEFADIFQSRHRATIIGQKTDGGAHLGASYRIHAHFKAFISKCFVSTAVIQLAEQGKINLDTPIVQYLPYFRLDDERCTQITTQQILSHTSGMPDMDEVEYEHQVRHPERDDSAAERYVSGLCNRKMVGAPEERFAYSNIAYDVLGDLIAKVSGQTFENFLKEHILRPSGMPDSTYFFPDVPRERLAIPHLRTPEMMMNPVYP